MATMKLETSDRPDLKTLIVTIAHSAIVVRACGPAQSLAQSLAHLPAGYDKADAAVLRWIAADSRRTSPSHRSN